jgi:hypothetical protein
MKIKLFVICAILLVNFGTISYCQDYVTADPAFSAGVITGYNRGYGIQANFTFHGFAEEFPFEIRFGIGYSFFNPGKSWDARRIFINNATNGVPEKKADHLIAELTFCWQDPFSDLIIPMLFLVRDIPPTGETLNMLEEMRNLT